MTDRTIHVEYSKTDITTHARVKYNREYEEYRVVLTIKGIVQLAADYFTDDKADAIQNAKFMIGEQK
jgi:hypothetical protein